MGHGNYDVADFYAGPRQRKPQCVSSVSYAYAVFAPAEFRERPLELLDHRASDETGSAECGLEHSGKLLLELDMSCCKIQEWNAFVSRHFRSPRTTLTLVSRNLFTRAGFPVTMAFAGTSFVTTLPAPTIAFSPIVTLQSTVAPDPIDAPFLTTVRSTLQSFSVCSWPSDAVARG